MHRALAGLAIGALLCGFAAGAGAQVNPPVPAPIGPVNAAPGALPPTAPPTAQPPGLSPSPGETSPPPAESPSPGESPAGETPTPSPAGETPTPSPAPTPTQPPIVVDPSQPGIEPGRTLVARVNSALGTITATIADPAIATVVVDQTQRTLSITGRAVGTTTITVSDQRGVTRDVPLRVAYDAGTVADQAGLRVTGDPASAAFLREAAATAARRAATLRPGARATSFPDAATVHGDLPTDDRGQVDVPVQVAGEGYFTVSGTTHVQVENFALPRTRPAQLLVSDYPERLTADGVLFAADIDRVAAQRFMYYHFNPPTEPARRILVKVQNPSPVAAIVHLIAATAGPSSNELEVGHNATKTFLVRERRNEGTVITIPPNTTLNIVNQPLPPNSVVNGIVQVREVSGNPLKLAIVAQLQSAPLDQSVDTTTLLSGGAPHARGIYPVPEFFSESTYFTDGAELDIPIGQLPLPNLRSGEALSGDYGVKQSIKVVIVNSTRSPQPVAVYANPRGGGATGTFLIDDTLVQAHRLAAFTKYKLWQETIPPGTFRTLQIVTMPEGGSSYPLNLIFAPDDGSVAPGSPNSPIY